MPATPAACRAIAATELSLAGALRRDLMAGFLGRAAVDRDCAVASIRICLRHARAMNVGAYILGQV